MPDYVAEASPTQFRRGTDLKAWVNQQQEAGKAAGCTFFRATTDLGSIGHTLVEGWTTKPDPLPPIAWLDEDKVEHSISTVSHANAPGDGHV